MPTIHYDFNEIQGIWKVSCGTDHFFSTGLARARRHAAATFPVAVLSEKITTTPELDTMLAALPGPDRSVDRAPSRRRCEVAREVCVHVRTHEVPLGVGDLSLLLGCPFDTISRLWATS